MKQNLSTYQSADVVKYYEKYESLQNPEKRFLEMVEGNMSAMDMLDIGIGAGRTTLHFAPRVNKYTGIDYAGEMVKACLKKFGNTLPNADFRQADVRDLSGYAPESFHLVLFSFNGMDYILPEERKKALAEIYRVMRKEGYFFFSTHNLIALLDFPAFEFRLNIFAAIRRFFEVHKIKRINRKQFEEAGSKDVVVINDGAHDFKLETCYYRPSYQVRLLQECGFGDITIFDLDGEKVDLSKENDTADHKWLYYLARKR
jgi:SAM-dependent methyltransferase